MRLQFTAPHSLVSLGVFVDVCQPRRTLGVRSLHQSVDSDNKKKNLDIKKREKRGFDLTGKKNQSTALNENQVQFEIPRNVTINH